MRATPCHEGSKAFCWRLPAFSVLVNTRFPASCGVLAGPLRPSLLSATLSSEIFLNSYGRMSSLLRSPIPKGDRPPSRVALRKPCLALGRGGPIVLTFFRSLPIRFHPSHCFAVPAA